MHPNQTFRQATDQANLAFVRDQGFGTLVLSAGGKPLLSHVPFWMSDDGHRLECHLVRSNPIARHVKDATEAVLAVTGPHGYVSPDWYGHDDQVPTWNYVAVHLRGTLSPMPDPQLRSHLDRLSAQFEARLAPKPEWRVDKMSPEALAKMMRQIVPFEFAVLSVEGTWKLGQNKPQDARQGAADAIGLSGGAGQETALLGKLMSDPPC